MVLDTHIFIWYVTADSKLPVSIEKLISAEPESTVVPSVCLWETMLLIEKGRLRLRGNPEKRLRHFVEGSGFQVAPLTMDIAFLSRSLSFEHDDPADRFIAATAKSLREPLATLDRRLQRLPWLRTVDS